MKPFYYTIFVFSILLVLTSCTKPANISIKNMITEGSTYQLETTNENINLKDYISSDKDYEVIFEGVTYSSKNSLEFTLSIGHNNFSIKNGKETLNIIITRIEMFELNIKIGETTLNVVAPKGTYLKDLRIDIDSNIPSGYEWEGMVQDTLFERVDQFDSYIVDHNATLEIILSKITYEVSIDSTNTVNLQVGEIINFVGPSIPGKKFIGWNTSDGMVVPGDTYEVSHGTTFEACYEDIEYFITYQYNNTNKKVSIKYGEDIKSFIPEFAGFTFNGWYYNNELFTSTTYTFEKNIVLVGSFTPNEYIITYTNIDGDLTQTVIFNETFKLHTPTKEGYAFKGWLLNDQPYSGTHYTFVGDITLVATWEKLNNSINLNLETFGGTVNNEALVDSDGNIILPIPEKENYKFNYWCTDAALTKKITSLNTSTYNNEKLYAHYSYDSSDFKSQVTVTLFNAHASNYDQLAMFDGNQSGFTSLYWHKVAIKKQGNEYIVSAIATSGEKLSSLGEYDFVILGYSSYPYYGEFTKMDYSIGYKAYFTVDPSTLKTGSTTIQVSFVAPNIDEDLEKVQSALELYYKDYESVSENIELLNFVEGYSITWKTSNKNAISSNGIFTKPYVTRSVTLTAMIGEVEVYNFTVEAIGENETSDALATGYIYTPYNTITQNAMNTLDIIYCAFLEIDANGNWTNESRLSSNIKNYILPKAKISGTKVVVSVNQSQQGYFGKVSTDPELRSKLATNIVKYIIDLGLDGVDIDWETPTSAEAPYFTLLMKEIYEKTKAANPNYLVTAAIGGGKWAPPKYDLPNSKNYLDYINLMTYSMASDSGYYQNSLYKSTKGATLVSCSIEESIEIYNDLGVKNSQILVGIPFYTTVQTSSGGPGSKTGNGKSIWYDKLFTTYALSDTMKEYFDEECGVPYRYDSVNKIFISFDNERSIMVKCDYINTLGLAGIMYWQYGQDVNDMLSNAINKYINK